MRGVRCAGTNPNPSPNPSPNHNPNPVRRYSPMDSSQRTSAHGGLATIQSRDIFGRLSRRLSRGSVDEGGSGRDMAHSLQRAATAPGSSFPVIRGSSETDF